MDVDDLLELIWAAVQAAALVALAWVAAYAVIVTLS